MAHNENHMPSLSPGSPLLVIRGYTDLLTKEHNKNIQFALSMGNREADAMSLVDDFECREFRPSRMRPYTPKPEEAFERPSCSNCADEQEKHGELRIHLSAS
jgi:hypothetical protein